MKALQILRAGVVSWVEVPEPQLLGSQVLLAPAYVGICGSDLHYFFHGANGDFKMNAPMIPGHELSARVVEDPSGRFSSGAHVVVHPARFGAPVLGLEASPQLWPGGDYLGSAAVNPHRDGGASERLAVDVDCVYPLPASVPLRRGSLAEPLAVAVHSIFMSGFSESSIQQTDCLIVGCGPIGLLACAALRVLGARSVAAVDLHPEPLIRATTLGADEHFLSSEAASLSREYQLVLECSGSPSGVDLAVRVASAGAKIVQVGMPSMGSMQIDLNLLITRELSILGAFRFAHELPLAIDMLADPRFDEVITHSFLPGQAEEAFSVAADSRASGKVLFDFESH